MAGKGYEKINDVKALLKEYRTVEEIALHIGRGPRTAFRYLEYLRGENCGLRKGKNKLGQTAFKIQVNEQVSFNQESIKQLEKIKKNMTGNSPSDMKNRKLVDKLITAMQTTNPDEFRPEAITTDKDLIMDYGPWSDNKIQDLIVNKVLDAIHCGVKIRIAYHHATLKKDDETIEITPVKVVMRMDTVYIIGADDTYAETGILKMYMLENVTNIVVTNKLAQSGIFFDEQLYYKYAYGKYINNRLEPQDISLMIRSENSGWLKTQFEKSHFNPPAIVRKDKNKNDIVDLKLRLTPDCIAWLMGILPDVKILKPESLKRDMKALLKKTLSEMED
jgi:predicted DNA-binding transcriptional regulator YafY